MGVAMTLQEYLDDNYISYDVIKHKKTNCSSMTAKASHIPGANLAKGVVLKWDDGYFLAIIPTTCHVDLDKVEDIVKSPVSLATEEEASRLFPDCQEGAVPALPIAYGLPALVDDQLSSCNDIYFEGGDHRSVVHLSCEQFDRLMCDVPHASFCVQ